MVYTPPCLEAQKRTRGRPRVYGEKLKLFELWDTLEDWSKTTLQGREVLYTSREFLWRPAGSLVQFIFIKCSDWGPSVLMTTDLNCTPSQALELYQMRFRIEVTFRQAIHTLGALTYRFWLSCVKPWRKERGAGRKIQPQEGFTGTCEDFQKRVQSKLRAYRFFILLGFISQGLLHLLSLTQGDSLKNSFTSWFRTQRPEALPSENMTLYVLKQAFPSFLKASPLSPGFVKFLRERINFNNQNQTRPPPLDSG